MTAYFNRSEQRDLRRRLRKDMPLAEVLLRSKLRSKQLLGMKFRRQYSVGPFCVDFFCAEIRLAIELDGDTHFTEEAKRYDRERQAWIESFGIRFLRFTNTDLYENLDGVLHVIALAIESTRLDSSRGIGAAANPLPQKPLCVPPS
jgi:very-short-patch-repair endonuclease